VCVNLTLISSELEAKLEAILFAAGEPVPIARLCAGADAPRDEVEQVLQEMADRRRFERCGVLLVRIEDAWQLCTAPEYADCIRCALETRKAPALTGTALEVLSVVAYRQPVTRSYIEQVRGVDSAYTVGSLVEKGLIEECGRMEVPGRPILYRTTDVFLRTFGISSLSELPALPELSEAVPAQGEAAGEQALRG